MKVIIRIVIAIVLVTLGLLLLLPHDQYPLEHFEFKILDLFWFDWKTVAIISRILIGLLFVFAFLLLFYWRKIKIIKWLSVLMIFIPFIVNPVFPSSFKDATKVFSESIEGITNFKEENNILIYVSPNCLHCKEAIFKLHQAKKHSSSFPKIEIVSYNTEIEDFLTENSLDFDLIQIEPQEFINQTRGVFPVFQQVVNNKIIKKWSNKEFNYAVLDNLSKKQIF